MKRAIAPVVFTVIALGVGFISSWLAPVGDWYVGIQKSQLTPPGWVFPIAWTIIYILIGIAGGIVWNECGLGLPIAFWFVQAVLNGLWSIVFFRWHLPTYAFIEILILLAAIISFIFLNWQDRRMASFLFIPYAVWVTFASYLTFVVAQSN